ncbi:hypothetical protein [Sphingomonas alpina]|uniref:Uncharacterized protein n=1 Tax=Sphingomonas alpina TaxID=653931 RepID=A0A7H0LHY0_9SPHN|nr:hypothetical protein [Sphingomonas alpina]QNQ09283.1 hypothetical protein H3Z74_21855 [Sphingomonas alpina]
MPDFQPFSGFDPIDGAEAHMDAGRDNPCSVGGFDAREITIGAAMLDAHGRLRLCQAEAEARGLI